MIKRILFFLALFFAAFMLYFYVNRNGAENFITALRGNGTTDSQTETDLWSGAKNTVDTAKDTIANVTSGTTVESLQDTVKDSVLVVSDDIKQVVSDELGLDNREGTVIVMQNPTFNINGETTASTDSPTTTKSTTTNTTVAGKLSQADLDMLARLARNID